MYSGEGGGYMYYGLVVVTQPRPRSQTFLCERDYLKNHERIASIFYIYINIGEWIVGKQVVPILLIEGVPSPPPPTRIAKNAKQNYIEALTWKLVVIFSPYYPYLHCHKVILP